MTLQQQGVSLGLLSPCKLQEVIYLFLKEGGGFARHGGDLGLTTYERRFRVYSEKKGVAIVPLSLPSSV